MVINQEEKIKYFLNNLTKYKFIAHRLGFLMEGYPENSLDNVTSMINNPDSLNEIFGIELDIQFTKDHIPVIIHDANTADISETSLDISKSTYEELQKLKCGYRRSDYRSDFPWEENNNYTLQTLNNLLSLISDNEAKFADKKIKIETKSLSLKKEDLIVLSKLFRKYKRISDNILHISFFPWNLSRLKKFQLENGYKLTQTEFLIDFSFERLFVNIWDFAIDGISLGLKNKSIEGNLSINSKAKRIADLNAALGERRNAVSEEYLRKIIAKYGYAGLYTINNLENIVELLSRVSNNFLDEYAKKLVITSDNPVYLKKTSLKIKKEITFFIEKNALIS